MKRLWFKIFFVLVTANVAFAILLYWGFTWSFELAFTRYLKDQEEDRFRPLVAELINIYQERGNWRWVVEEHQLWQSLMREYVVSEGNQPRPGPAQGPGPGGRVPPFLRSQDTGPEQGIPGIVSGNGMNPHLLLFDANGDVVIGNMTDSARIYRFPILNNGQQIATLGVRADTNLLVAMQAVIANQNNDRLVYILLGLLVLSSISAFLLATWMTTRIFRIKEGTSALVRGQYDHRIAVRGNDALSDLAHDFNGLAEALQQNRSAHQRWIASTSHELRTPVTILQGQIDALKDGIRVATDDYMDGLSHDIERLNLLIDDLHQLSMSDIGALNYQKDELDFAELVDDELAAYRQMLPDGLQLHWHYNQTQTALILGDGGRLGQVIKNLMQNSIRYTELPGAIWVSVFTEKKDVVFVWEDSSPGVNDEDYDRLTEPLYRLDTSRNRKVGGSGLGLAISNAIVQAHGATMTATASDKGGLKWTIRFDRITG